MGCRILVVDDEQEIREVIAEYLEALGHTVDVSASGREAMESLARASSPFDIALVDWNMPGIAGRDVIRDIARRSPDTEVLITTGYMPGSTGQRTVEGMRTRVIHKPFSLNDLRTHIDEISREIEARQQA